VETYLTPIAEQQNHSGELTRRWLNTKRCQNTQAGRWS